MWEVWMSGLGVWIVILSLKLASLGVDSGQVLFLAGVGGGLVGANMVLFILKRRRR